MGIRLAIGAHRGAVFRQVAAHGVMLVLTGLAIGTVGAIGVTRVLDSLLFQISTTDPATLITSNLILGTVGVLACVGPALRASRVDPQVALRDG